MSFPSASELLGFLVELEDDPARRNALANGWSLFEAVRDGGLVSEHDMDGLGRMMGELVEQGLMRYGSRAAGGPTLHPGALWNGAELQQHHDYATTALGRADAERFRRRQRGRGEGESPRQVPPGQVDHEIFGRRFQHLGYVFDLPPGSTFPMLPRSVGEEDARLLRRYVSTTQELAGSSALNQRGVGYKVEFEPSGMASVDSSLPSAESVRAVAVLFRQLYANEEPASYERISGLLRKHVEGDHDDEAPIRRATLDAWREAQAKLRAHWLERLVIRKGQELGRIPPEVAHQQEPYSPEQVLSAYFYGEHIHWDRRSVQVEAWAKNPLDDARHRLLFLQAIGQLSSLYIGFAALVVTATPWDDVLEARPAA